MTAAYRPSDLARALQSVGLRKGDVVFAHVDLEALGEMEGASDRAQRAERLLAAFAETLGAEGTLLVPTYTFSFCRQEPFDPAETPTRGGPWSPSAEFLELVRRSPGAVRSRDPIHSVAGIGPQASALLEGVAGTCFGRDSVFERMRSANARICTLGVGLDEATFRHHVEEMVGVPFRFRKLFTGKVKEDGAWRKTGWIYNVRILADNGFPDGSRVRAAAERSGRARLAALGQGCIASIDCESLYAITEELLRRDPWATAKGPAGDPVALETARVRPPSFDVRLPENASMAEMIDALWWLPRNIVSDAFDASLDALGRQLPMTVHEYPAGSECWSWIVPEKWTCFEAALEKTDGTRIFSTKDHPLHVVQYSLPFEGVVSRDELFAHLHVHERNADAIPYVFKYYERDWGLCCSRKTRDALKEEKYRVVIRSDFRYAAMRVGEVVVPGESDESIVLCSHLCHAAQAMDDLSGVVVGMEAMRRLRARPARPHYTYRYLIVPETIGSVAYLSRSRDLIPKMRGGLYLEMLGLENPLAFQKTLAGDTPIDRAFGLAVREAEPDAWIGAYRTVIGNDERQFNGPGVRVPMASLSRVLRPGDPSWPYPEYHSSADNRSLVSTKRLEDSVRAVLRMIETLEEDQFPVNLFEGEVFCSRYGLHIDPYRNREGHDALFRLMDLIDGSRSIGELAVACGISFGAARDVVGELRRHGLVRLERRATAC